MFLFTAIDRVPPFGLDKKIDVVFKDDITYPKICSLSTCSLNVTLPIGKGISIEQMLVTTSAFGSGIGEV